MSIVEKRVRSKTTAARYSNPWINTFIRKAIRRKQKARKTGKKRDIDRYKRLQAEVKYNIKQTSKSYLENIISEDFNSNAKKFWSYIESKRQESTGVSPLKSQDGFLKSDSTSKAEILNTQFKSVFTEEDLSNLPHKGESPYPNMDDIEVSEKEVLKFLQNFRQNKATGPDSIPAYILKIGAKELSPILTKLFQWSLFAGQVPSDWNEARS